MTNTPEALHEKGLLIATKNGIRIPISTKLILGFLLVIVVTSIVFIVAGIQLIGNRIVAEAQEKVRNDLNAAREIYLSELSHLDDVARFTADRFFLRDALSFGNIKLAAEELIKVRERENLDILTITDNSGKVLLRTNNVELSGDDQSHNELIKAVLTSKQPVVATSLVAAEDLQKESPRLAEQARFKFIDTPKARAREETEETRGMMLEAAAPVFDY
ncbi:MAG: hypothetical protein GY847_34020, partial [Proteobacteria bacterium]|nr:hypothetical protein [Pseudomonadota bacterium]